MFPSQKEGVSLYGGVNRGFSNKFGIGSGEKINATAETVNDETECARYYRSATDRGPK